MYIIDDFNKIKISNNFTKKKQMDSFFKKQMDSFFLLNLLTYLPFIPFSGTGVY